MTRMEGIRRMAERDRVSVGEWVRRTLREARLQRPASGADTKLKAVRRAAEYSFPTGDIDQILNEIERGYQS